MVLNPKAEKGFIYIKDILQVSVASCSNLWGSSDFYNDDVTETSDPPAHRLCAIAENVHCSKISAEISKCEDIKFDEMKKTESRKRTFKSDNGEDTYYHICENAAKDYVEKEK